MQDDDLFATLRHLIDNGIEFIVVGGVAAVLNGAPITTFDIDLVYSREPRNLLPQSKEADIGDGILVRVLNLETIISVKEQLAGEKDLAVLPILRRTLKEIRRL